MTHFHIIHLHNPQLKLFKEGYFKWVFSCNIFLLYFLLLYKYVNICYFLNYDKNIKSYKEYCIRTLKYHPLLSTKHVSQSISIYSVKQHLFRLWVIYLEFWHLVYRHYKCLLLMTMC